MGHRGQQAGRVRANQRCQFKRVIRMPKVSVAKFWVLPALLNCRMRDGRPAGKVADLTGH